MKYRSAMINDLRHGYDVSSTLTSNFSADFDFLSPSFQDPPLEYGFRESSFPRKTRLVSSVPFHDFCFDFHFLRRDRMRRESKRRRAEYHRQIDTRALYVTWFASLLPSIASDRFPTRRIVSPLLRLYCFTWCGKVQILPIDRGFYKDIRFPFGFEKFYRAGLKS